jgi:uncharacterized membrane protein YccC
MDNSNKSHTILESPLTQSQSDGASAQVGEHVNRFLLCTLVSRTAREIRAAAERNGERLSLLTITRDVLRSALRGESLGRESPVTSASGLDPFDEDALIDEIGRQLQERISPGQANGAEALRPDLASVIAAEEAKPEQPGFVQSASAADAQQTISRFDFSARYREWLCKGGVADSGPALRVD